jgi:hypothetical protein
VPGGVADDETGLGLLDGPGRREAALRTIRTAWGSLKESKPWQDYCGGERPLKQAIEKLVKTT